jgi:hypothetical protein
MRLGTTPLSLHDLTPKKALFELTLPGYDPTPVSCEIPEGQTLKVEASSCAGTGSSRQAR